MAAEWPKVTIICGTSSPLPGFAQDIFSILTGAAADTGFSIPPGSNRKKPCIIFFNVLLVLRREDVMIQRVDHVSIAVRDYEKARAFFQDVLGAIPGAGASDDSLNFYWQIFSLGDLSRIELITPTGAGSFLDGFLSEREGGVHHVTLQVPDIRRARQKLEELGVPFFGFREYGDFWKELFIHPRDAFGVLIQMAQFKADDWLAGKVKLPEGKKYTISSEGNHLTLSMAHPGGGTAEIELTPGEAADLADAITAALRNNRKE